MSRSCRRQTPCPASLGAGTPPFLRRRARPRTTLPVLLLGGGLDGTGARPRVLAPRAQGTSRRGGRGGGCRPRNPRRRGFRRRGRRGRHGGGHVPTTGEVHRRHVLTDALSGASFLDAHGRCRSAFLPGPFRGSGGAHGLRPFAVPREVPAE